MAREKMKPNTKNKKGKGKGKKWKKGHSSDSNPEIKKHRLAAKNRFFNVDHGPSNLTVDALAKHDAAENDADGDAILSDVDSRSQGGLTFNTWASNWTECTNTTFNRVHRYWRSNSALHKEILAVLAAVTEVIKAQGGNETETEYFGALMTALDTVDSDISLAAITYLLSLAIKRVSPAILKSRFSDISKALLEILAKHANSDTPSLLRSVVMCLATLLRVQDQAMWNHASTTRVYDSLLSFVTHPKPKVRKAVQQAVCAILKGASFMTQPDPPPYHPAASTTAKFCIKSIEESGGGKDASGTLHTLELLKYVLAVLPPQGLKSACETILRVMTLSHVVITSVSMRALHSMFAMKPKAQNLPPELNAQLITALYDYQPGENDLQPMAAWLAVMEAAHINLAQLDPRLCVSHLPRIFASAMKCMQTDRTEVAQAAAKALTNMLKECAGPEADRLADGLNNPGSPVYKMFTAVEKGLGYQFQASWVLVLQVLQVFFEVLGKHCPRLMDKCLLSMADLRDSYNFPYKHELDKAVGMAVKTMGPKHVLNAVPLQITGENDNYQFPRSWLLPVIRDYTQETELAFFIGYFLPLAAKLRAKAAEFAATKDIVKAKTYATLQAQIWSLLPGFCINPTDLKDSFKGIAKILGSALNDRQDLHMDILSSLRKLINQNLENEDNRNELAKFAKNYLPILFNMYTTENKNPRDGTRQAVLETIKTYMQISDKTLVNSFFDKAMEKLDDSDISSFRRHALMDIMMVMVAYLDEQRLGRLYKSVVGCLESNDHTVQKKAYRVLEEMCMGMSPENIKFVSLNLDELQEALLKSLSSSAMSSRAPRLRCLCHIFKQLEEPQRSFMTSVIPEAILCTKRETGERARAAAYNLLTEMGNAHVRWSEDSKEDAVTEYFEMLMAGLAGSPHMISATMLALTRILFEYKDSLPAVVLDTMVDNICILLSSKTREIVQSVLGFVKVLLSVFPDTTLAKYLQQIVQGLASMAEDTKRHSRLKHKVIFNKLVKKFGFDTIRKMVPESYSKMLGQIRKEQQRAKKKTHADSDDEDNDDYAPKLKPETIDDLLRDTDSEVEEDDDNKSKGKRQKKDPKKLGAWLKEGGEDVIDFLDPSVSKKVLASQPKSTGPKKSSGGFKFGPDGRMIITEDPEDNDKPKSKKRGAVQNEDMDDLNELLDALEGPSKKSRKRKLSDSFDMDDDEGAGPMQYKAGGSGIHRPIGEIKKNKKKDDDPGNAYKAKKAGGDIKKKGMPNPYAYLPLQRQALNKRKRKKVEGQFTNLVKGAKKGAAKGQKMGKHKRKK